MLVTPSGILISVNFLQLLNASPSMLVSLLFSANVMLSRLLPERNAEYPMLVTPLEMVTLL